MHILLVRRKILHLLLLAEGLGIGIRMASACRDAKSCVSRAKNSAMTGTFRLSLLCILACETQDFASLLWLVHIQYRVVSNTYNDGGSPVETQNLASPVQKTQQ